MRLRPFGRARRYARVKNAQIQLDVISCAIARSDKDWRSSADLNGTHGPDPRHPFPHTSAHALFVPQATVQEGDRARRRRIYIHRSKCAKWMSHVVSTGWVSLRQLMAARVAHRLIDFPYEEVDAIHGQRRWPVARLRAFLVGRWNIHRSITDHRLSLTGALVGIAEFTAARDGLYCRESGRLSFGSYEGAAHRELLFVFPDDGCADVRFTDGRPFHALDLRNGIDRVEHRCGSDIYSGWFEALDAKTLRVSWLVTGPRKHQQISTCYRRMGPAPTTDAGASDT